MYIICTVQATQYDYESWRLNIQETSVKNEITDGDATISLSQQNLLLN